MQGALQINGKTPKATKIPFLRIVTIDKATLKTTHEYTYVLDDPAKNATAVSEITALSDHQFLIDERDGNFEPNAYKKIFEIDTTNATDVLNATSANIHGATDSADKGLLIDGKPLEALFGTDKGDIKTLSKQGEAILKANGITPVRKTLYLDFGAYVSAVSAQGLFFGHDKIEGIYPLSDGRLLVSNDSDFGIDGLADPAHAATLLDGDALDSAKPPYTLHAKLLPNGKQDDGAYMIVDVAKANKAINGQNPAKQVTVNVNVKASESSTPSGNVPPSTTPGAGETNNTNVAPVPSGSGTAPTAANAHNGGVKELSKTGSTTVAVSAAAVLLLLAGAAGLAVRKVGASHR
jgi:hypothetical protein